MTECLNAVGFVFNSVKTYIKTDKSCKYLKYYCQNCGNQYRNQNRNQNRNQYSDCEKGGCIDPVPGFISPCNKCDNNTQYKICIFKLKKEFFVSSSLDISTSSEEAWIVFKKNIIYQKNGNFVISLTDCNNKSHSFFANLIKAKLCDCCDAILLYFKYNIITLTPPYEQQALLNVPADIVNGNKLYSEYPYTSMGANLQSNITYNLKSGQYKTIRFFNSSHYTFENSLKIN